MMEAPFIVREYSPSRALQRFTDIPEGCALIRVTHPAPGSIYHHGMFVVVDPDQSALQDGVDVVRIEDGGPRHGFRRTAKVSGLRLLSSGWWLAPGGFGHSTVMGADIVTLLDGPYREDGLRASILGRVIGYLGHRFGQPVRGLWDECEGQPVDPEAFDIDDFPLGYNCVTVGDCLAPVFNSGDRLHFSAVDDIMPGDFVGLHLKPHLACKDIPQLMVKRLVTALPVGPLPLPDNLPAPPVILVETLNPPETFAVPLDQLMAVHKCNGIYDGPIWSPGRAGIRALAVRQRHGVEA